MSAFAGEAPDLRENFLDNLARQQRIQVDYIGVVKQRIQLVEFRLEDHIIFVIMTLGATGCQSQPSGSEGHRPINHLIDTILFQVGTSLPIAQRVAEKPSPHPLRNGCSRQQVSRELFDGELIERHIAMECIDHPLPISPSHGTKKIL